MTAAPPNITLNNAPNLTLDGGEFRVDVRPSNNTNPASGQLGGTLTVLSNSTISNGNTFFTSTTGDSRIWGDNATISIAAGATLRVRNIGVGMALVSSNLVGSGTVLLADHNARLGTITTLRINNSRFGNPDIAFNLGTGGSSSSSTPLLNSAPLKAA